MNFNSEKRDHSDLLDEICWSFIIQTVHVSAASGKINHPLYIFFQAVPWTLS